MTKQSTKLDRAKVALTLDHPFFASILLKRGLKPRDDIPTAAVDQRGQIYYNPKFVESLTVPQLVFLLAHEVGHVIYQHAARRGSRDPRNWNIAGDAVINDMLKAAGVGQFIDGGVDMPGSKDKTADEIYNSLPKPPDGSGRVPGSGDGSGDQQGPGGIGDDLLDEGEPLTKDEADRLDAEIRVDVAQAAQAAKMRGKMPAALAEIVANLIDVPTPWHAILERHMTAIAKGEYTWARPNRRYLSHGHYLPNVGNVHRLGEIVVQVDISGSISQQEIQHYNGHLKRIVELCQPERVHVLYTDTSVRRHVVFEEGEEFGIQFYSGGGTDMVSGIQYLDAEGIDPEVFVCLTDGYFHTTPDQAPTYPVIWCVSTEQTPAFGEVVRFSLDDA